MSTVETSMLPPGPSGNAAEASSWSVARSGLQGCSQVLTYNSERARSKGFEPPVGVTNQLMTEMRALKRRILDVTAERRSLGSAPLVLVTSAMPGDGKSFVSFHLALALSREKDLAITLVDADIVHQEISKLFLGTEGPGLTTCLMEDLPFAAAVRPTNIENLTVVRAGACAPKGSELLASSRWDRIAGEIRATGSARMFVVDTAPVLATSESQYLARTADLALFVVRSEVTPQEAVAQALARFGDLSRIAFVLNDRVGMPTDFYYDYDGYYASDGERDTPSANPTG